jgi:Pyridoxamine 5'-phosphate oxidase
MPAPAVDRPHMPDYGVGPEGWQGLPWHWAATRLAANRNYWVVTVSSAGRPHALPVWGVWHDAEQRFAFSCGPRSRKARDLAGNTDVAVTIDDTVECVSIEGTATVVADVRADEWIDRYLAKYQPLAADLSADFLRANVLVEVTPRVAFGMIEREDEFACRATRWTFGTTA